MKTFLLRLTPATALALCLACGGGSGSRRSSTYNTSHGYNSSSASTSSSTRSTTSDTSSTGSNTRASSSGNTASSAGSSYGGGSASSGSAGYAESADSARQRRYAAYQDWKARWNKAIQLGPQVAVSGNNELFNQWLALQQSLVNEFNQNRYAEFDSPPSGSGGYSGGYSGGRPVAPSRSTRACGTCRGTGVLDTCAYRNAYEQGFDPSSCRKTCPSCGGKGHIEY